MMEPRRLVTHTESKTRQIWQQDKSTRTTNMVAKQILAHVERLGKTNRQKNGYCDMIYFPATDIRQPNEKSPHKTKASATMMACIHPNTTHANPK